MAQQSFFLNSDQTKTLTLTWGFNWKNLKVNYLGEVLGEIATKKELEQGREFELPHEGIVSVKLKGSFMPQLEVLLNGEPVKNSATDPEAIIQQIFKLSLILGVLNFSLGLVATFWPAEILLRLGMGIESCLTGIVIIALAFGIKKRSMVALIASISFWIIDYAASIYFASQESGGANPSSGLIMRMVIVYSLYRGIGALKQLKNHQAESAIQLA